MNEFLRKYKKRLIIGGIIGIVLALLLIWFCSTVYDPFMSDVGDLLVLVPEDADFVLEAPDFPTLIKGLEDRFFFQHLERNREFQRFLESARVVETQLIPQIRRGFREMHRIEEHNLPLDLKVLGDLSGEQVVVTGYFPKDEGASASFMAILKPETAWAIMGVNLLIDETTCDWFIASRLEGIEVEHFNWGAKLHIDNNGEEVVLGITRVDNAVLIGNDVKTLARVATAAKTDGVPAFPSSRFEPRWVWEGAATTSINLLVRREPFDERVKLYESFLEPMWGVDLANVVDRFFPQLNGEDLYMKLDIDNYAQTRFAVGAESRRPTDPFSDMRPVELDRYTEQLEGVLAKLPHYVFAHFYANAAPADLIRFALGARELVDADQKYLLDELLATKVPRFMTGATSEAEVPDMTEVLVQELRRCFHREVGVALFKKHRLGDHEHSDPGVAVTFRIKDREYLEGLIKELDKVLEGPFDRYDLDEMTQWHISKTAWLDDPESTNPGFGIMGDHFIVTNWFGLLNESVQVSRGLLPGVVPINLEDQLATMPEDSHAFVYVDPKPLYEYMEEAKEGWVMKRAEITTPEMVRAQRNAEIEADRQQIHPSNRDVFRQQHFTAWLRRMEKERNPVQIRKDIETNLNYFRQAFSFFFGCAGVVDGATRVELRLGVQEKY